MKLMEMTKGKDILRYGIVHEADSKLSELNKAANLATGNERKLLRDLYNQALRDVVAELDKVNDIGKE